MQLERGAALSTGDTPSSVMGNAVSGSKLMLTTLMVSFSLLF